MIELQPEVDCSVSKRAFSSVQGSEHACHCFMKSSLIKHVDLRRVVCLDNAGLNQLFLARFQLVSTSPFMLLDAHWKLVMGLTEAEGDSFIFCRVDDLFKSLRLMILPSSLERRIYIHRQSVHL